MKTNSNRWSPVRKGKTFCSPGCGHGCTHAQYLAAVKAAEACLKRMTTKGWKVRVHDNLGWFWCLEHESGLLTVSGGQLPYGQNPKKGFHAMLSSTKDSGACDTAWYDTEHFDDPNEAVTHRLQLAASYIERIAGPLRLLKTALY
jgi:hypothetical protein